MSCYLVVGLGKTGHSIARYLQRQQQPFEVFDTRKAPDGLAAFQTAFPDVNIHLESCPETLYPRLKALICSPGVALDHPVLQTARQQGIPIMGDIEYFAREVKSPVIAITGTNGKSTVTTLVGEMAKAAGLNVAVAGNIGEPVLDRLGQGVSYDLWVLELSSFQLDLVESLKPLAATILNITPDHLDRHHDFAAYRAAKQRIYHHAQYAIFNRDDEQTTPQSGTEQQSFGLDSPQKEQWGLIEQQGRLFIAYGQLPLIAVDDIRIKGRHNWVNVMAACALSAAAGISQTVMVDVLRSFSGLPHRTQWVRRLHDVDWINDSKGTNVGATLSAITGLGGAMPGKIILIAGGQGKGADFSSLRPAVANHVRTVVLMGEDADKIALALSGVVPLEQASSLEIAIHLAQKNAQPGDVVLLSPACASFDMFRDFNHRGEMFTALVNAL